MRLIDADALKTIRSIQSADYNSIETIQHWIDNAPTIDAVPVEVVADMFGEVPCNYAFCASQGDDYIQVDDFMNEHCGGWCEDKCGEVPTIECWKRFFKAWVERRDDE